MYKIIVLCIILNTHSYSLFAQPKLVFNDSLSMIGVFPTAPSIIKKNGIKKVLRYTYTDKKYKDSSLYQMKEFDTAGNVSKDFFSSKKLNLRFMIDSFVYDTNNRLIEKYHVRYKKSFYEKSFTFYQGDTLAITTDSLLLTDFKQPKIDSSFKETTSISYVAKHFNPQQQLTAYVIFDSSYAPIKTVKYWYNENGLIQRIGYYNGNGNLFYNTLFTYKYSKKGMTIEVAYINSRKQESVLELEYNNLGQCISSYMDSYPERQKDVRYNYYTYNPDGTLFSSIIEYRKSSIVHIERFYYEK